MSNTLKVGDKVMWRGAWALDAPQEATVVGIDLCKSSEDKYGDSVKEVDWRYQHRIVVTLDNNHWAYGYQIEPMPEMANSH